MKKSSPDFEFETQALDGRSVKIGVSYCAHVEHDYDWEYTEYPSGRYVFCGSITIDILHVWIDDILDRDDNIILVLGPKAYDELKELCREEAKATGELEAV